MGFGKTTSYKERCYRRGIKLKGMPPNQWLVGINPIKSGVITTKDPDAEHPFQERKPWWLSRKAIIFWGREIFL